jgi:hypothetical protein
LLSVGEQHSDLSDPLVALPENFRIYSPKIPHPNDVRATLILWPQGSISARYRQIIVKFIKEFKKSKFFKQYHKKKAIPVAFDLTDVDYYGKDEKTTKHTRGRSAAKRCHRYLTLQILCPAFRMIVDVQPIFPHSKPLGKIMKNMLRRAKREFNLKLDPIYLDRGFYQIEVLREMFAHFDRKFRLPASRTQRVKDAIVQWYQKHGYTAGTKELMMGNGRNSLKYTLIFAPLNKEEREHWRKKKNADPEHIWRDFLYFCLQKPPNQSDLQQGEEMLTLSQFFQLLSLSYKGRWGIETGYRGTKGVWGWTTSTSYNLRLWLMWNAVLLYNIWIMENFQLLQEQGIPKSYICCKKPNLEDVEYEEKRKEREKLPANKRSTNEKPRRKWIPRPIEPLRYLCDVLQIIAQRLINWITRIDNTGYDPPKYLEKIETRC